MKIEKILKCVLDEFTYSGYLISFGAVCIVFTSAIILQIRLSWQPLVIIYLLTFGTLLYNRYKEKNTDFLTNPLRTACLEKYFHFIFSIVLFSLLISAVILIFYRKVAALVFISLLFLAYILYTKYLKRTTRKIIVFKNICFSLIVSLLIVFLAIYYSYFLLSIPLFLIFLFVFLRMFINTVFLDIKDVESDKKNNLKTFPIVFGYKKTILILKIISLLSGLLLILGSLLYFIPTYSLILLLVVPYSFYYFKKSENKENFYLVNYVLADAEFILWLPFILIGKTLI